MMAMIGVPPFRRPPPISLATSGLPLGGTPSECLQDVYEEGTRTAALEKLKRTVPDQMTEEADEKSRPLKDPSSMQDWQTQFEMYFLILNYFIFYIINFNQCVVDE